MQEQMNILSCLQRGIQFILWGRNDYLDKRRSLRSCTIQLRSAKTGKCLMSGLHTSYELFRHIRSRTAQYFQVEKNKYEKFEKSKKNVFTISIPKKA